MVINFIIEFRKLIKINFLFVLMLFSISTSSNLYSQGKPLLKINTGIKSVNCSELFEITRYIKLETNKESLINTILSIKFRNDTVFTFSNKKVYLWNYSGKFLGSIGKIGHGSTEMLLPSDFAISPSGNKIGIWDNKLRSLYLYNNKGKFLKKVNPGLKQIMNFEWTNSNQLIFYSQFIPQDEKRFSLYLTDTEGKFIKSFIPYDSANDNFGFMNFSHFPRSGKSQYVWTDFDNTIYEYKNNSLNPSLLIEFDKGNIRSKELAVFKGDTHKLVDYMNNKGFNQLLSFNDLGSYYIFSYSNVKTMSTSIISKDGTKQYRIQHLPASMDPLSEYIPIFYYNNELVCIVEPYQLKTKLKQTLAPMKQRMGETWTVLDKLCRELKDDDNPVILFLKFKGI